jgi:tryptophan synthase alpha chain
MTNRIDKRFKELRSKKKKAFIAYITAGDPDLGTTKKLVMALEASGADIIELGIPFSDPIADGPTIQAASYRALLKKTGLSNIFDAVSELRAHTEVPIVFMTYYNPVLKYGPASFFESCSKNGVDGVIVPDLPFEEAGELIKLGRKSGVSTIFLAAPTSSRERMRKIAKISSGFVYYVSLTGVTGSGESLQSEISRNVRILRSFTKKPVAVGFGVSNPAQARRIARSADGVIVGSAIVKIVAEKGDIISKVSGFTRAMAKAIHDA